MIELLRPVQHRVHIITADNGKEFASPETVAMGLEAGFYFAHFYSSWERGLNENTNGLIRQYFPKIRYFKTIMDIDTQAFMDKLIRQPTDRENALALNT